jgi:toxin ParE1/3/4
MAKYLLTNKAVKDLSEIWEYTFEIWSETQADKYFYMLHNMFDDLANGKLAGKHYNEISKEILGLRAGQHIIFYRKQNDNGIEITRILHSSMDLKNRIKE